MSCPSDRKDQVGVGDEEVAPRDNLETAQNRISCPRQGAEGWTVSDDIRYTCKATWADLLFTENIWEHGWLCGVGLRGCEWRLA